MSKTVENLSIVREDDIIELGVATVETKDMIRQGMDRQIRTPIQR